LKVTGCCRKKWETIFFEKKTKAQLEVLVSIMLETPANILHSANPPDILEFQPGIYTLVSRPNTQSHSNLPTFNSFLGRPVAIRNAAYLICFSLWGREKKI
jgi:hypothetical protein